MKHNPTYYQILDELRALDPDVVQKRHPNYYQLVEYLNTMRVNASLSRTKRHPNYHQFVEGLRELIEEGGGGAPEWVPEGATAVIDFLGDRAWTLASGDVQIDTLLGSDNPATEISIDETSGYDPALLEPTGYRMSSSGDNFGALAYIGEAKALLLAGATLVYTIKTPDVPPGEFRNIHHYQVLANGSNGLFFTVLAGSGNGLYVTGYGTVLEDVSDQGALAEDVVIKVALTIQDGEAAASLNGRPFFAADTSGEGWPFETVALSTYSSPHFFLHDITIYPIQSNADLQTLSTL